MNEKAQIWIETVIYTLVGLSIIAVILAIITPKIQEAKDKAVIDQSLDILDSLSRDIDDIKFAPGNSWPVEIKFDNGRFFIDGATDTIYFLFEENKAQYSEAGTTITRGRVIIRTDKVAKNYVVKLGLNYSGVLNITYKNQDRVQSFQAAAIPYDLVMESKGKTGGLTQINFES